MYCTISSRYGPNAIFQLQYNQPDTYRGQRCHAEPLRCRQFVHTTMNQSEQPADTAILCLS